jgi:hypothetical protein
LHNFIIFSAPSVPQQETKAVDLNGKGKVQKEAIEFMRGVMDEFTHLKNFSKPLDSSMIIVIAAKYAKHTI